MAPRSALMYALGKFCRYYRVPVPNLRIGNRSGKNEDAGWYDMQAEAIWLNRGKGGANMHVLLHEFAHYVTNYFYEDIEDHGPEFVAVYMHLLDKYSILPHKCFRLLARKHRVKIGRRFRPRAFR